MLLSIQSQFRNGLAIGIGVGLLSGFVSASFTKKDKLLQADHILQKIKDAFLLEGPVFGKADSAHEPSGRCSCGGRVAPCAVLRRYRGRQGLGARRFGYEVLRHGVF